MGSWYIITTTTIIIIIILIIILAIIIVIIRRRFGPSKLTVRAAVAESKMTDPWGEGHGRWRYYSRDWHGWRDGQDWSGWAPWGQDFQGNGFAQLRRMMGTERTWPAVAQGDMGPGSGCPAAEPPAPVAPPGLVPGSPSQRQPLATPAGPALAPALHHSAPLGPPAAPLAPSGAASSGPSAPASTGSPGPLEQIDQLRGMPEQIDQLRGMLRAALAHLQSIEDTLAAMRPARPDTGSGGAAARSAPAAETPGAGPSPGSDRPRP